MDGNGRWATARGARREEGHRAGSEAVRRVVRAARRLGLGCLTLYAFSEQNWARPEGEVDALMGLLLEFLVSERREILDNGIRLVGIGNLTRLPPSVRDALDPLSEESREHRGMILALALSYGGREEVAEVARELAIAAREGKLAPEDIDAALVAQRLPSLAGGAPDLIVRTGGEQRLSNFLLYGAADAELVFTERMWPDFTEVDLYEAVGEYQARLGRRAPEPPRASPPPVALAPALAPAPRTS